MNNVRALALVVLAVTICSSIVSAEPLIIAGSCISNTLSLNSEPADVLERWGKPDRSTLLSKNTIEYSYDKYGLSFTVTRLNDNSKFITTITIESSLYRTPNGNTIGSDISGFLDEFGDDYEFTQCSDGYVVEWRSKGIMVAVERDGRIVMITIFRSLL